MSSRSPRHRQDKESVDPIQVGKLPAREVRRYLQRKRSDEALTGTHGFSKRHIEAHKSVRKRQNVSHGDPSPEPAPSRRKEPVIDNALRLSKDDVVSDQVPRFAVAQPPAPGEHPVGKLWEPKPVRKKYTQEVVLNDLPAQRCPQPSEINSTLSENECIPIALPLSGPTSASFHRACMPTGLPAVLDIGNIHFNSHRLRFVQYYHEENEQLPKAAELMARNHGFDASLEQWRFLIRRWQDAGLWPETFDRRPLTTSNHGAEAQWVSSVTETAVLPIILALDAPSGECALQDPNVDTEHHHVGAEVIADSVTRRTPTPVSTIESFDIEAGRAAARDGNSRWRNLAHSSARELQKRPIMSAMGVGTMVLTGLQLAQKK